MLQFHFGVIFKDTYHILVLYSKSCNADKNKEFAQQRIDNNHGYIHTLNFNYILGIYFATEMPK